MSYRIGLYVSVLAAILSRHIAAEAADHPPAEETRMEMNRVNMHPDEETTLYVEHLIGKLLPTTPGAVPFFDDKKSFAIAIDSAEISIGSAALAGILNKYVFNDPKSPIRNVKLSMEGQQLNQKGTLHKGVELPFEMASSLSATPEGKIRIHPTKLKVAHLPVKGLLDFFGVETDGLVNSKHMHGIAVEHEDLILDPNQLIPAPEIRGKVTNVRLINDGLVETYGAGRPANSSAGRRNYIAYRGGTIRFGKLTMNNSDLKLIDANPRDPFDFSIDHYHDQIVAGYSKTTPSNGLEVFMPDYYRIRKSRPPQRR